MRRVLVVGGAGVFGSRLVAGLLRGTGFEVVVAGRDARRVAAFVAGLADARVTGVVLDGGTATAPELRATGAFVVVDAAGPWQGAGMGLARAAIEARLHYVDLADGRDFVAGFAVLDDLARAAGVAALTGASSTPALSNAALDTLTAGWQAVERVEIVISPGNRAPRGLSVMQAILAGAGQPVRVWDGGAWVMRAGWGMLSRRVMPGLGRRWVSLNETPDLDLVAARFAVRDSVVFRAGLELATLHLGLWAVSLVVRAGALRSLAPFARLFVRAAGLFERFGTDRGGMVVEATGIDATGAAVRATWWLVAEAGDGPHVPTLAALAVVRAIGAGTVGAGARACVGVVGLPAIEAEFGPLRIATGREEERAGPCLYERVLGAAYAELPRAVRAVHARGWGRTWHGVARVDGAQGLLARAVAWVIRLPRAADAVPVSVSITVGGAVEVWTRTFGERRFGSEMGTAGRGEVVERFGPFRFMLGLHVGPDGVRGMPVLAWSLGRVRMPGVLAPVSRSREYVDATGRFCFDVEIGLPLGRGRLVRYQGWLA